MVVHSENLNKAFAAHPCIVAAYLFGSVARERAMPWSDVDIALLFARGATPEEKAAAIEAVADAAEREFKRDCVPVDLREQGAIFQHDALRVAKTLFVRDCREQSRFVIQTIINYLDFLPIYRTFERAQAEYLRRQVKPREAGGSWE